MSAKEPLVIDLIDGEHHGAWSGDFEETDRGTKPKIRTIAEGFITSLIPWIKSENPYPYEIDTDRDLVKHTTRSGDEVIFIKPDSDIPGINVDQTPYHKLVESDNDEIERLKKEKKQLRKKLKRAEDERDRALEEAEEREKHKKSSSSGGSSKLDCRKCDKEFSKSQFKNNNGKCPNCNYPHQAFRSRNK